MKSLKRSFLTRLTMQVSGVLILTYATLGAAQQYPSRPITLVVQAAPGGSADLTARVLAQKLTDSMGVAVVVMNEPAAAGVLAVQRVVRAKPDGYTLLMVGTKSAISESILKNRSYNLLTDIAPIAIVSAGELAIVTNEKSKYRRLDELIQDIRARPGKVTIGTGDVPGGIQHMGAEMFKAAIKGDFVTVVYGSTSKLSVALRSGEIDAAFELLPPMMTQIKNRDVRALALSGSKKFPELSEIPTIGEAGVANSEVITYSFIAAPADTPKPILDRLNAEINRALLSSDVQEKSRQRASRIPEPVSPTQAKELLAAEVGRWREVVSMSKFKLD